MPAIPSSRCRRRFPVRPTVYREPRLAASQRCSGSASCRSKLAMLPGTGGRLANHRGVLLLENLVQNAGVRHSRRPRVYFAHVQEQLRRTEFIPSKRTEVRSTCSRAVLNPWVRSAIRGTRTKRSLCRQGMSADWRNHVVKKVSSRTRRDAVLFTCRAPPAKHPAGRGTPTGWYPPAVDVVAWPPTSGASAAGTSSAVPAWTPAG